MPRRLSQFARQPRRQPAPVIEGTVRVRGVSTVDDYVQQVVWSPDGELLAACSISGPVQVISRTGEVVQEWSGHTLGTTDIAWHREGRLLASVGQDSWVHSFRIGHDKPVWSWCHEEVWGEVLAWNPQGNGLAVGAGRSVFWLDPAGTHRRTEAGHSGTIADLAWAPDGKSLAVAHFGGATVWPVQGRADGASREWGSSAQKMAWSADGSFLATGNQDGSVHFWIVPRDHDLMMRGYSGKVSQLAWNRTSQLLATAGGESIVVWTCDGPNGPARTEPMVLSAHQMPVTALAFAPHADLLASGSRDGQVCLWHMDRPELPLLSIMLPDDLLGEEVPDVLQVTGLDWSPDGGLLAVGLADGLVTILQVD